MVSDVQVQSVDHLVHEQGYVAAIREQPKVNDDAVIRQQRLVGNVVGVEPEDESSENERIFAFQFDDTAVQFRPRAFERSSVVTRVE